MAAEEEVKAQAAEGDAEGAEDSIKKKSDGADAGQQAPAPNLSMPFSD